MHVGIPREIKDHEYRVGMLPAGVKALVAHGHRVSVETGAGAGVGATDEAYAAAGAEIGDAPAVWGAELVVKVKEPQAVERARLRPEQILFTYLHLAPDRALTDELLASGATAIAYETVTAADGSLPLLTPMSEIAGRLAPQAGAHWLEKAQGGRGVLLGGVPGVAPAGVLVLGGGVAGTHAATIALGMGAQVTVMDRAAPVLRRLDAQFGGRVHTRFATPDAIADALPQADLVIGAVLVAGAATPKLVTREMLALLPPGAVLVDIAIDQGGCFETSRATTHSAPTFVEQGIVHYGVANMPGAVARTSTLALTAVTRPFVERLANRGLDALREDPHLRAGLNVHAGRLTCAPVGVAQQRESVTADQALG
ncbi:MAG: alanine dehydrogenase [Burkholderiaceae bacterium]|nr:alanine dehydrogenase [Burkholderiaceae bacterium]